ncbi:unnamed protein product [Rhizophagus irregularis]|nr:unnamed protein product [Rhizophagus irregularis]
MIINNLIKILLLIILLIEIGQSLVPVERYAHSSVLVDKKLFFFGGYSGHSLKTSKNLDQIIYLDISKPFNTANPPFEEISKTIPFGSSYATAFLSPQKNIIYLFGGIVKDVNTDLDSFKSVLYSYNLETNEWIIPTTNGIAPGRRREINGVINNKTGKYYVFGGLSDFTGAENTIALNDMNIFDTISLTWSKGASIYAPLPRTDYTATLLYNGIIVFVGGRETNNFVDVDINQLVLYDTTIDKWSSMTARGVILENRNAHSAVLTPDERIIIFGGCKGMNGTILNQLAVLNTKTYPYEWSIPQVSALNSSPPSIQLHSATLIENYMFINFGQNYQTQNSELQKPFFYILDVRNFTWVTQFEPEQVPVTTNSATPIATVPIINNSPNLTAEKSGQIGVILGAVGLSVVIITVAGFLGYKFYKKQKYNRAIPTAGQIQT